MNLRNGWIAFLVVTAAVAAQSQSLPFQAPAAPQRIKVSESVAAGLLIQKVPVQYPDALRDAGVQGSVTLDVIVGLAGDVHTDGPAISRLVRVNVFLLAERRP